MSLHTRRPVNGECAQDAFEALHEALGKVRSTSTSVNVPKAALAELLRAYSNLIDKKERAA